MRGRNSSRILLLLVFVSTFALLGCGGMSTAPTSLKKTPRPSASEYTQVNLVSSGYVKAKVTDSNLVNPWGMISSSTSPIWISNQATNTSTLYTINNIDKGTGSPFVVGVPTTASGMQGPTGIVYNLDLSGGGFPVPGPNGNVPSVFIFDNLNGTISGWNPKSTGGAGNAVIAVNTQGALYKGLALGVINNAWDLYAADATPMGGIKVFDSSFGAVTGSPLVSNAFIDPDLPALPASADAVWTTFNVANLNGDIYVMYAPIPVGGGHPILNSKAGVVAEFSTAGTFMRNVAVSPWNTGPLDDPWGIAMAPGKFGKYSNALLIGNFGSGEILAYRPNSDGMFTFEGVLDGTDGTPITEGRLWTLWFGNGASGANPNTLYITTGGSDVTADGLFAAITPAKS